MTFLYSRRVRSDEGLPFNASRMRSAASNWVRAICFFRATLFAPKAGTTVRTSNTPAVHTRHHRVDRDRFNLPAEPRQLQLNRNGYSVFVIRTTPSSPRDMRTG